MPTPTALPRQDSSVCSNTITSSLCMSLARQRAVLFRLSSSVLEIMNPFTSSFADVYSHKASVIDQPTKHMKHDVLSVNANLESMPESLQQKSQSVSPETRNIKKSTGRQAGRGRRYKLSRGEVHIQTQRRVSRTVTVSTIKDALWIRRKEVFAEFENLAAFSDERGYLYIS